MRVRHFLGAMFLCLPLFSFASPALAVDPPTSPTEIVRIPVNPSDVGQSNIGGLLVSEDAAVGPVIAVWGAATSVSHSGGASLWCAGRVPSLPYYSPAPYWPYYPNYAETARNTNEKVTLVGTAPVQLLRVRPDWDFEVGDTFGDVVVKDASGTTYPTSAYIMKNAESGYPTIERNGTAIPSGSDVYVSYNWRSGGTATTAALAVPGLVDYYESYLSFYYLMPSLAYGDDASFAVRSYDPGDSVLKYTKNDFAKTTATGWTLVNNPIMTHEGKLSRRPGTIEFGFDALGGWQNTQGPSVDDIVVSGFKYGPVDSLNGVVNGSTVSLTWGKPNQTPASSAVDDDRAIAYRVWRKRQTDVSWSEITARLSQPGLVDSTAQPGNVYDYLVQAWDMGTGTGYGRSSTVSVAVNPGADTEAPVITVAGVVSGQSYGVGVAPTFSAADNVGVTSLIATLNNAPFTSGTPITSAGSYTLVVTAKDARNNTATKTVSFAVGTPFVQPKPKVSLGTPVAPKTMTKNKSYNVYGSLKPRHTSGTKPVRIYKYKKVSGKWKSYGYTTAKAYNYSTYSRYKAPIKLTSKGSWRLRAYAPADSKHAATWSAKYDYVTAK